MALRPYTVVTRVLEGETSGLLRVSDNAVHRTMPYFEVVRRRDDTEDNQESRLVEAAERIADTWRFRGPAFVEIYDAIPRESGWWERGHPIAGFYKYLRHRGVEVVPTTSLDRSGDFRNAFIDTAKALGNGLGARLYSDDLELPENTVGNLVELLADANIAASQLDVVINLERLRSDQLGSLRGAVIDFFAAIYRVIEPRSITLIGSSVPENLSGIPENGEAHVRRLELSMWRDVGMGAWRRGLPLRLGDYGVVRPEYVDRKGPFPNINARLIYTVSDGMFVLRGCSRKKVPLDEQYGKLASKLAAHRDFSDSMQWADRMIRASARAASASGQPKRWISVCTSRHVEYASTQTEEILANAS